MTITRSFAKEPPPIEGKQRFADIYQDLLDQTPLQFVRNESAHRELFVDLFQYVTARIEGKLADPGDFPNLQMQGYAAGIFDAFLLTYGLYTVDGWVAAAKKTAQIVEGELAEPQVALYPQIMIVAEALMDAREEQDNG